MFASLLSIIFCVSLQSVRAIYISDRNCILMEISILFLTTPHNCATRSRVLVKQTDIDKDNNFCREKTYYEREFLRDCESILNQLPFPPAKAPSMRCI